MFGHHRPYPQSPRSSLGCNPYQCVVSHPLFLHPPLAWCAQSNDYFHLKSTLDRLLQITRPAPLLLLITCLLWALEGRSSYKIGKTQRTNKLPDNLGSKNGNNKE